MSEKIERAGDKILNRFASRQREERPGRSDIFLSDYRQVIESDPHLAEVMIGYDDSTGVPPRQQVVAFMKAEFGEFAHVLEASMQHYPQLSRTGGAITALVKQIVPNRPMSDVRKHGFTKVADTMYLDAEGACWQVEKQGDSQRLIRSDSGDDLMSILAARRAKLKDHSQKGLTFTAAFEIQRTAGRATLGIGDTVSFYLNGKVFPNGVIQSMEGNKVTLTHPSMDKALTVDREQILNVTQKSDEAMRAEKIEQSDYYQEAYGFDPELTNQLTDMPNKTASVKTAGTSFDVSKFRRSKEYMKYLDADELPPKKAVAIFKKFFPEGWLEKNFKLSKGYTDGEFGKNFLPAELMEMEGGPFPSSLMLNDDGSYSKSGKTASQKAKNPGSSSETKRRVQEAAIALNKLYTLLKAEKDADKRKQIRAKMDKVKANSGLMSSMWTTEVLPLAKKLRSEKTAEAETKTAGGASRSFPISRFYNLIIDGESIHLRSGDVIEVVSKLNDSGRKVYVRVHQPAGVKRGWTMIDKLVVPPPNSPWDKVAYMALRDMVTKLRGTKKPAKKAAEADFVDEEDDAVEQEALPKTMSKKTNKSSKPGKGSTPNLPRRPRNPGEVSYGFDPSKKSKGKKSFPRKGPKKASSVITADDFQQGDSVQLVDDYQLGTDLSNDVGGLGTGKVETTSRLLPKGTTGRIDRVINYGTESEKYVVHLSDGTMLKMDAEDAVNNLQLVKASTKKLKMVAGVKNESHARDIVNAYCVRNYGSQPDQKTVEVFSGEYSGSAAMVVNACLETEGWRRIVITADRVVDTSPRKMIGVSTKRSSYDALAT